MSRRLFFRLLSAATTPGDHVPDSELLRRFTSTGDSAAFELLVRRHADAVWAAGLRVLGNSADAEDVFQSTFLVLARKAGSIRGPCVGGWLQRVAVNAALKLRAGRTPSGSEGVEQHPAADTPTAPESAELAAVVHQELARLPDRYRLPVVLCDLEGQTHAQAAAALGWPVGSVSGRLSRARDILRDRLTRRGLAPGVVLSVALSAGPAPAALVGASVAAACGTATVSPVVLSLTAGVISAMRLAKLKLTAAVLAAGMLGLAGIGTVYGLTRVPAPVAQDPGGPPQLPGPAPKAQPPAGDWTPKPAGKGGPAPVPTAFPDLKPPALPKDGDVVKALATSCPRLSFDAMAAVDANDDTLRRLRKARLYQGQLELQLYFDMMRVGRWGPETLVKAEACLRDIREVVVELWDNDPKALVPWLEELVVVTKLFEDFARMRFDVGTDPQHAVHATTRHRLQAEAALWKAKNPPRPGGPGGRN